MNTQELFKGVAVIIDNDIERVDTEIHQIRQSLASENIPIVTYPDIPDIAVIKSLSQASFLVMDWEFVEDEMDSPINDDPLSDERVRMQPQIKEEMKKRRNDFLKEVLSQLFIPVFIFTHLEEANIQTELSSESLWYYDRPNRILIKQKSDVINAEGLFQAISDWLKEVPSVYCLKEWERIINSTKNKMFLEFYQYSPSWAKVVWRLLHEDGAEMQEISETQAQFGDFLSRNLINRTESFSFDPTSITDTRDVIGDELQRVIEGERYIAYPANPISISCTGDLYKWSGKYYLNIRAQCDLLRKTPDKFKVYLIKGTSLRDKDLVTEHLKVTEGKVFMFGKDDSISLDQLSEDCCDPKKLDVINQKFIKHRGMPLLHFGTVLSKQSEVIITCIGGQKAIKFTLDIDLVESFAEHQAKRIGRILPPYITYIQELVSHRIVRQGTMPTPPEIFAVTNYSTES